MGALEEDSQEVQSQKADNDKLLSGDMDPSIANMMSGTQTQEDQDMEQNGDQENKGAPGTSKSAPRKVPRGKGRKSIRIGDGPNQKSSSGIQKKRAAPGVVALQEIVELQKTYNLIIPRAAFGRLVKEISHDLVPEIRWTKQGMEALQDAAETHMINYYEDCGLLAINSGRVTIQPKDMKLARRLRESHGML